MFPVSGHQNFADESRDHLQAHSIWDCAYCFQRFDDSGEYIRHREDTCTSQERVQGPRRDGIDPQQWGQINGVSMKRSKKSYTDVDKWMDVWKIIFPDVPTPDNPC